MEGTREELVANQARIEEKINGLHAEIEHMKAHPVPDMHNRLVEINALLIQYMSGHYQVKAAIEALGEPTPDSSSGN